MQIFHVSYFSFLIGDLKVLKMLFSGFHRCNSSPGSNSKLPNDCISLRYTFANYPPCRSHTAHATLSGVLRWYFGNQQGSHWFHAVLAHLQTYNLTKSGLLPHCNGGGYTPKDQTRDKS